MMQILYWLCCHYSYQQQLKMGLVPQGMDLILNFLESPVKTSIKRIQSVVETTLLDHIHTVYCDMELQCSGLKGGWMKIADYDTSKGDNCPSVWKKIKANGLHLCRSPNDNAGYHTTHFQVKQVSYNKICGRVKGYQKGLPGAFRKIENPSIDNEYVEGISITLGTPRKHVWSMEWAVVVAIIVLM